MKGSPAVPGGPLTSKPTPVSTFVVPTGVGLFCFGARGDADNRRRKDLIMLLHLTPLLADYIWVGGGSLGLIILIVVIVVLVRR